MLSLCATMLVTINLHFNFVFCFLWFISWNFLYSSRMAFLPPIHHINLLPVKALTTGSLIIFPHLWCYNKGHCSTLLTVWQLRAGLQILLSSTSKHKLSPLRNLLKPQKNSFMSMVKCNTIIIICVSVLLPLVNSFKHVSLPNSSVTLRQH